MSGQEMNMGKPKTISEKDFHADKVALFFSCCRSKANQLDSAGATAGKSSLTSNLPPLTKDPFRSSGGQRPGVGGVQSESRDYIMSICGALQVRVRALEKEDTLAS
jgi:hypothetical protein